MEEEARDMLNQGGGLEEDGEIKYTHSDNPELKAFISELLAKDGSGERLNEFLLPDTSVDKQQFGPMEVGENKMPLSEAHAEEESPKSKKTSNVKNHKKEKTVKAVESSNSVSLLLFCLT